jgi:hypothetical protein
LDSPEAIFGFMLRNSAQAAEAFSFPREGVAPSGALTVRL